MDRHRAVVTAALAVVLGFGGAVAQATEAPSSAASTPPAAPAQRADLFDFWLGDWSLSWRHPDGTTTRKDRYNWVTNTGPEARSVTARLDPERMLDSLHAAEIARLFARSRPVSRADPINQGPELVRGD